MTTDCLDVRVASPRRERHDLALTDRHLKIAGLTAAVLVIFVLPGLLALASLFA